jgi:hypothetical protein
MKERKYPSLPKLASSRNQTTTYLRMPLWKTYWKSKVHHRKAEEQTSWTLCEICGSHGGEDVDVDVLLGCDARADL